MGCCNLSTSSWGADAMFAFVCTSFWQRPPAGGTAACVCTFELLVYPRPLFFRRSQETVDAQEADKHHQHQTSGDNAAWATSGSSTDSTWGGGEDESMEDEEQDKVVDDFEYEEAEENWQLNSGAVARQAAVVRIWLSASKKDKRTCVCCLPLGDPLRVHYTFHVAFYSTLSCH